MQRTALQLLGLVLLANISSAAHKDERLGFTIQTPNKWTEVPVGGDDRWMVGKYMSDRTYTWNGGKDDWPREHKPDMQMIAFVEAAVREKAKLIQKEKRNGRTEWVVAFESPYKDYKDYLTKRYTGGGWFITEEKEDKVGDVPVTCYQIKVEKASWDGPKHLVAWVYHVADVDVAVQFEALEDTWPKLQSEFLRCLRSFKSVARSGEALYEPSTSADRFQWEDEDTLSPDQRRSRRATLEKAAQDRAVEKLPDGWTSKKMGRFLVLNHADDKFAKRIVEQADAVWRWLDETFEFLGPKEYVRSPILRICKDRAEYDAYCKGQDWYSANDLEIATYDDNGGSTSYQYKWVNQNVLRIWLNDRDRGLSLAMPGWIGYGLLNLVENIRLKNGKFSFRKDDWDRDSVREAARGGDATRAKDLFVMSGEKYWQDYVKMQEASQLVDYLAARGGARDKRTKELLPEYMKNLVEVVSEIRKEEETSKGKDEAKPKTEAEEDAMFKKRRQSYKVKEQRILEDTFRRTFGAWSDADWKSFEAAYDKAVH